MTDLHTTDLPIRLATASLIGLVVGLEREWSGYAIGQRPRFAGLRTFFLIGLAGGIAGTLIDQQYQAAGVAILVGVAALCIVAYASAMRGQQTDLDGTTEVAAIVVLALGVLAAFGELLAAAAAGAIVVLMLGEKARLHWLVRHISPEELEGALQFAVLAFVVLPLLPVGPFGGILDIRPRVIWSIVLLFSALNYCGYVARRVWGANRGYAATGVLGGLVSSTAVTLQFARLSATPSLSRALSAGVIGACTILFPRILVLSAFINPAVALALIPRLLLPSAVGVACFVVAARHGQPISTTSPASSQETSGNSGNPLALLTSIRMALAFQIAISVIALARAHWGTSGLYTGAAVLGFTDVDALTVSATQSQVSAVFAAQAIMLGIIANTALKLTISSVLGRTGFRGFTVASLGGIMAGCAASLWLAWQ
jgi:uncharacterized membrane protein (DUF4010 family)